MKAGRELLVAHDLFPLVVADSAAGGSTDSQHLLGFGHDLGTYPICGLAVSLKKK